MKATSRLVAVAPNPSIDRLVEVDVLHHGEIHRPLATMVVAGGKGFNVARAAASLGAPVTAVGPLAGNAGRWIAEKLASEGLEVAAIWTDGETRTCTSIFDRSDGSLTEIYEPGVPIESRDWARLIDVFAGALKRTSTGDAGLATVSGSLPPGGPEDGLAEFVSVAASARVRIAIDGHGAPLVRALAAGPWLVKVNLEEARAALGEPAIDAEAAVRALIAAGAANAIVTMGRHGALVSLERGSIVSLVPPVLGPYSVGAGDAFLGGFAGAILQGDDLRSAAIAGTAAAAASTLVPGPGRVDVAASIRMRREVRVEPIGSPDGSSR